jgi:hypothetical protein
MVLPDGTPVSLAFPLSLLGTKDSLSLTSSVSV